MISGKPQQRLPGLLFLSLMVLASCTENKSDSARPNIIFIMADDLAYGDLSGYGQTRYQTPVLDKFISEGINFVNGYSAAAVCTPTRVALMTGQYPARNEIGLREPLTGSKKDENLGLSSEIASLSSLLKLSGYETALYGKWHLGTLSEYLPSEHGFDHFFGTVLGGADYVTHTHYDGKNVLYESDKPQKKEGYLTDLITDYTLEFINQEHETPFFINLQYTAPHAPWQAPGDGPAPLGESAVVWERGGSHETYAGMVKSLDMNIGRILEALIDKGLDKSTLVIFTSDNGGLKFGNNLPFQGHKGQLWEGGIRVPAAVRWPGVIQSGKVCTQMHITMDWTVTILGAAKVQIPNGLAFDGIDLSPYIENPDLFTRRKFYWRVSNYRSHSAFRDGDFKYLKIEDQEFLFNIDTDPGETKNLKNILPAVFDRLESEWDKMDSEMLDPIIFSRQSIYSSDNLVEEPIAEDNDH